MASLETTLIGNLTDQPKLYKEDGKKARATFGVAITFGRGTENERTEYADVTAFGKTAENAAKLKKGTRVVVPARQSSYKQEVVIKGETKNITRYGWNAIDVAASVFFDEVEVKRSQREGSYSGSDEGEQEAPAQRPAASKPAAKAPAARAKAAAPVEDDDEF